MVKKKSSLTRAAHRLAGLVSRLAKWIANFCDNSPGVAGTLAIVILGMTLLSSMGLAFWR